VGFVSNFLAGKQWAEMRKFKNRRLKPCELVSFLFRIKEKSVGIGVCHVCCRKFSLVYKMHNVVGFVRINCVVKHWAET
jgi:hypothetical protein